MNDKLTIISLFNQNYTIGNIYLELKSKYTQLEIGSIIAESEITMDSEFLIVPSKLNFISNIAKFKINTEN
jgi:hypothetical protein